MTEGKKRGFGMMSIGKKIPGRVDRMLDSFVGGRF